MQGIFQKENTDKALKYGIYRHLPTYEKIIRNLVSFSTKKLRFSIIQYLNLLETVLIGWQNGIVDRDIIESQFTYLHDPTNNKNCLQDFRTASGSEETYPSIEAFCIKLEENRKKKLKGKDYIA